MQTVLGAVARSMVLEMILEGRILEAEEAGRRGLVSRVVADDAFDDEIKATADRIAEGAPLTVRATKKNLNRLDDSTPLSEAEINEGYDICDSKDYAEGLRAFLAKEKPTFEGK